MGGLVMHARTLMQQWARKGGKRNRRMQVRRALAFAEACEQMGARAWAQVGKRHVIRYYKRLRAEGVAPRTAYYHFLAIRVLWEQVGLPGQPPRPSDEGR